MEKAMIEATEKQLGLLWHTLGLGAERSDRSISRNHFLTSPGYDDAKNLNALVAAGLMTCSKPPAFCSQDEVVYRATDEGKQFALNKLPPPLRRPSAPSSMPTSTSVSVTTGSPTSSGSINRRSSSAAPRATTSTGWSATRAEVPTVSIAGLPGSRIGRHTRLLRSPVRGLLP